MKGEKVFVNQYGKKNDNWIVWEKLWLKIFGSLEKPE